MSSSCSYFEDFRSIVKNKIVHQLPFKVLYKIKSYSGAVVEFSSNEMPVGQNFELIENDRVLCSGEVVSIRDNIAIGLMFSIPVAVGRNCFVRIKNILDNELVYSKKLIGKIVDAHGADLNSFYDSADKEKIEINYSDRDINPKYHPRYLINPLDRDPISNHFLTGIKSIDGFVSLGQGQRIAVMAGSGVGKSVLMSMIAKNSNADVNVIAMIGERGREVLDFIEHDLGVDGLKKSVIVVATSDMAPLLRIKAAETATNIADYFRNEGMNVMLFMDSLTRYAMAAREVAIASGEALGPRGYPASLLSKLPQILERAGTIKNKGSITGIYTVLVESGDFNDPIVDAIRAITDGHLVLSRKLAERGHYPAVDVLASVSRVMSKVVKREHLVVANYLKELLAIYNESEDLINMGAYVKGQNIKLDKAILVRDDLNNFLKQSVSDDVVVDRDLIMDELIEIARKGESVEG